MNHSHKSAHDEYVPAAVHSLFLIFFPLSNSIRTSRKLSAQELSEANYTDKILDYMASAWFPIVNTNRTFFLPHISAVWTILSPWNRYLGIIWISSPFSRQPEKNRWRSWHCSYQWNKLYPWWDGWVTAQTCCCLQLWKRLTLGPFQTLGPPSLVWTHLAAFAAPAHHKGPLQAVWQWFSPPPAHH